MFSSAYDKVNATKWQEIDSDDNKSVIENDSDNELPISSIIGNNDNITTTNLQKNYLDDDNLDIEYYTSNELPLSSIGANIIFPNNIHHVVKDSLASQNVNHDNNSEISSRSNGEQSLLGNLTSTYECDICGKIFPKHILIIEHFRTSLCFPESSYYINNNSSKHKLFKNPRNVMSHINRSNILVSNNMEATCKYKIKNHVCHEKSSLKEHKIIHNLKKANQCNICQKYFNSKSSVSKHISRIHNVTQKYECSRCSKVFYKYFEIVNHIFNNHQEDYSKYSCDPCLKQHTFSDTIIPLTKHYYKCQICPRSFTRHRLDQHFRWHLGINDFECEYCSRRFSKFSVYVSHEKTHVGGKPFICHLCGKWFPVSSNINIHTNNSFRCEYCQKSFSQMSLLLSHEEIHLKAKHSNIESFHQLSALSSHTQQICMSKKSYKCNTCYKTFKQLSVLNSHLQTHVDKDFQEKCTFSNVNKKKNGHINNECFECDVCHEIFFDQNVLNTHRCTSCKKGATSSFEKKNKKMYKNELFKCDECSLSFMHLTSLNRHKIKHLKCKKNVPSNMNNKTNTSSYVNKEYKCDLCNDIFDNQSQIYNHILKNHY